MICNHVAVFINRRGVAEVYLPKTYLRGEYFHCFRRARLVKYRLVIIIIELIVRIPVSHVNAFKVRNPAE